MVVVDPLLSVTLGQEADFAYIFNPFLPDAIYDGVNIPEAQVSGEYNDGQIIYKIQCCVGPNPVLFPTFEFKANPKGTYDEVAITLVMNQLSWSASTIEPDASAPKKGSLTQDGDNPPTVTITGRFDVEHLKETLPQFDQDSLWALRGDAGQALLPHQIIRLLMAASYGAEAKVSVAEWDKTLTNGFSCAFEKYLEGRTVLDLAQITGNDTGTQTSSTRLSYANFAYPKSIDFGVSVGGTIPALVAMMSVSGSVTASENKISIGNLFDEKPSLDGALVASSGIVTSAICNQLQSGNLPGSTDFREFVRKTMDGSFDRDREKFPFGYTTNSFPVNFAPEISDKGDHVDILTHTYDEPKHTPDYTIHNYIVDWDNFDFSYQTKNVLTVQYVDEMTSTGSFGAILIAGTSTFSGSVRFSINNGPNLTPKDGSASFNNNKSGEDTTNDSFSCTYAAVTFSDFAKNTGLVFSASGGQLILPSEEINYTGDHYSISDAEMVKYLNAVSGKNEVNAGEAAVNLFAIQFPIIAEIITNTERKDTAISLTGVRLLRSGGFGADLSCETIDLGNWVRAQLK